MNNPRTHKVVIDSNIVIYRFDPKYEESVNKLLNEMEKTYYLVTSSITGFEVIKNTQNWDQSQDYIKYLNTLNRIPVDTPVLVNAATLFYKLQELKKLPYNTETKELLDKNDRLTGDLLIGGTVLSYANHLLLTANKKDFPDQLWNVLSISEIGDVTEKIKIYLLQPNELEILKGLNETHAKNPDDWRNVDNELYYEYRG